MEMRGQISQNTCPRSSHNALHFENNYSATNPQSGLLRVV